MRRAMGGVIFLSLVILAGGHAETLADSTTDFSGTQGGKNWYYGYFPNGSVNSFTQLPIYNSPSSQWQQTTYGPPWTGVAANSLSHPNGANDGAEEWAVREWVSTYTGPVVVSGNVAKASVAAVAASTGIFGRVYWNHSLVYEHFVAGTDAVGFAYTLELTLKAGDILDFVVAPNGNDSYDSTVFTARISTPFDIVSVDFGSPVSVKATLGILNGFDSANAYGPNPSNDLLVPLQAGSWRGSPDIYSRVRSFAPTIPFQVLDLAGIPGNNYGGIGPPWLNSSAYENFLNTTLSVVSNSANVTVEPWNETDDAWAPPGSAGYQFFWNGTALQFYVAYLDAFRTVRNLLGQNTPVEGPTYETYDHQAIQDFLEFCLAYGCEVNSLTWHELIDRVSPAQMVAHVQDARASFLQNPRYAPLKIKRIDLNEIVGIIFTHQPAGSLAYYSALEASGADGGVRSCWTFGAVNECFNGTISGLLTADTFQPRSVWWLFKAYQEGVASRVAAASSNADVIGVASAAITSGATPQILVGNSNFQNTISKSLTSANVNLSLAHLDALGAIGKGSDIGVRVEWIPDSGTAALTQMKLLEEINAAVVSGSAQIGLPPLQTGDVYRVTLLAPFPGITSVVDAASGGVRLAPGMSVIATGTNLPADASAGAMVGGQTAQVITATPAQWKLVIPADIAPGFTTLKIGSGAPFAIMVSAYAPALFSADGSGSGLVQAVRAASASGLSSAVSATNPALPGDTVTIYGTGFGAATPAMTTVWVGATRISPASIAPVTSSPGAYQVVFTVPAAVPVGNQNISVSVGSDSTKTLSLPVGAAVPTSVPDLRPPAQTYIYDFSGSAAIAPVAPALDLGASFSIEFWMMLDRDAIDSQYMRVFHKGIPNAGDPYTGYELDLQPGTHQLSYSQSTGSPGSSRGATISAAPLAGQWYHVAIVNDNLQVTMYLNGQQQARFTAAGPPPINSFPLVLAGQAFGDGTSYCCGFPGSLRQFRIWGRALQPSEITANATRLLAGNEVGLIADWPLDDGQGETFHDIGPNHLSLHLSPFQAGYFEPSWLRNRHCGRRPIFPISDAKDDHCGFSPNDPH